ncbi:hypothetical protein HYU12_02920 [Candidatus Woesearchaeota archaeon]|nr:hypothetical protein [Candidatus Woesearchaeota archaeon]
MESTMEEIEMAIKNEFHRWEIRQQLPKLGKKKEFNQKEIDLIEVIRIALDTGITCYGAYQFGDFLGRMSAKLIKK